MAKRVLVTDANSTKALAIIRSLGPNYEVFAAGTDRMALGRFSKYCIKYFKYNRNTSEFVNAVLSLCKVNKIEILITPEEESSFLVSQRKEEFAENGIILTVPSFRVMQICMNKPSTLEYAAKVGVPIPRTEYLKSTEEAFDAAQRIGYPVVVRPVSSHYWTGQDFIRTGAVGYARNYQELKNQIEKQPSEMPPPFLQKYVEGRGMSVLFAMNKHAEIVAMAAHEGIREYRPTGGTLIVRRSIAINDKILTYCTTLLKEIGYDGGVLEVEFRVSNDMEKIYFMEINPRFWATVQGPIDAGVDFPAILVATALGQNVPKPDYKVGVVTRWWFGDLIRFLRVLKGKPKGYEGYFPSRWKGLKDFFGKQPENSHNEVLRLYDIMPAIMEFPCMLARYFGRRL